VNTAERKASDGALLLGRTPLEGTLISPYTPYDASDTVGEGDGSDVMATSLGGTKGPGLEGVRLGGAVGRQESGAGPVNEEHPQVAVTPFRDRSEAAGGSGGGLSGREAELVGKATARGKALDVTGGGNKSGGREDSDARDGHEESYGRDEGSEALELTLEIVGLGLEVFDLTESFG
jgi:hypothetical protein